MTILPIRSGKLKDYRPLGEEGNAVYRSAGQLLEAIRLQLGSEKAAYFARPKVNEAGDGIDWYPHNKGLVVPWSSASPAERSAAKASLQDMQAEIGQLSERMLVSTDEERRTFGKLLTKITVFPGDDYVYLVDGKPVLSFWGFSDPNQTIVDPLDQLTVAPAVPTGPAPGVAAGTAAVVLEKRRGWPWWMWLLLLLLLLALLFMLRTCATGNNAGLPMIPGNQTPLEELAPNDEGIRYDDERGRRYIDRNGVRYYDVDGDGIPDREGAVDPSDSLPPEASEEGLLPEEPLTDEGLPPDEMAPDAPPEMTEEPPMDQPAPEDMLPNEMDPDAEQTPPSPMLEPPADNPPQDPQTPPEPMSIPPEALQSGDSSFLDGNWQATTGLMDERGRPVDVQYEFDDKGQGQVKMTNADGQTCVGGVSSSMSSGGLTLKGNGAVKCPDGSEFSPADVNCKVGKNGQADCSGSYESGETFGVQMERDN